MMNSVASEGRIEIQYSATAGLLHEEIRADISGNWLSRWVLGLHSQFVPGIGLVFS